MNGNKCVKLRDIFSLEQLSPVELIRQLQKDGLLANSMSCAKCNIDMFLQSRPDKTDMYGWRCSKCGSRKSVRTGSWFAESHLSMTTALLVTYMWVYDFNNKHVVRELEIAENTVVDWFNFCREVCVDILLVEKKEKIGGPGVIVEIDESKFDKRKYNRGKRVNGQWVFGGVERDTGKCFLEVVEDRTSKTLVDLIKKSIKDGTIVISDCWKAYDVLSQMDYEHLTVNHSINFKDPNTGAHTNTIEGMWSVVKRSLPQTNRSKSLFSSYLAAFMYRRLRKDSPDLYFQFILDIAKIYNPNKI